MIDTRAIEPGDLFVGPGRRARRRRAVRGATRWRPAPGACSSRRSTRPGSAGGAVLAAADPLAALQRLATAWRRELDAAVIGVTGSVGKTSTKQLIAALIAPQRRVAANPANFNTEIGLPLAVLAAPRGHRGAGAGDGHARVRADRRAGADRRARRRRDHEHRPGPSRAGRVDSRASRGRRPSCSRTCRSRSSPPTCRCSSPYLREGLDVVRFGTDVMLEDFDPPHVTILARELRVELEVPFTSRHQLVNLLAAVAAAQAVGVEPSGRVDVHVRRAARRARRAASRRRRHQRLLQRQPAVHARRARRSRHAGASRGGVSPCSETCSSSGAGEADGAPRDRRVRGGVRRRRAGRRRAAVGGDAGGVRRRVARRRPTRPRPPRSCAALVRPGDVVLVKASRGIGLETVAEALARG